jgi:hypothetical protein
MEHRVKKRSLELRALAFRVLAKRRENGEPVPEVGFLFAVAG